MTTRRMDNQLPIQEQPTAFSPAAEAAGDLHFPSRGTARPRRRLRWLLWLIAFFTIGSMLLAAVAVAVAYTSPYLLPGTVVLGLPVGGLTLTETAVAIGIEAEQKEIVLETDEESIPVSALALGLRIEPGATAAQAHAAARSWTGLRRWARSGQLTVEPVYTVDLVSTERALNLISPTLEQPARNANVHIVEGHAQALPAVPGQALDVAGTVAYFAANTEAVLVHGRLPLSLTILEPAIVDVSEAVASLNERLSITLVINAYDPINDDMQTWSLSPAQWGSWLLLDLSSGDANQMRWRLDQAAARRFVEAQSATLGDPRYLQVEEALQGLENVIAQPVSAAETALQWRIYHAPSLYTVEIGESLAVIGRKVGVPYPWIQAANPGLVSLTPGQIINIPSPDDLLPYPVVPHKRIVVDLGRQTTEVYEHGQVKWSWTASTGIVSSPTAPGIFQVQSHVDDAYAAIWDLWMPNFIGIYRPVPTTDFMNGFHGFPTRDGANLLWTNNLGAPVTYGCVLLSNENAQALYEWAEVGVIVEVRP